MGPLIYELIKYMLFEYEILGYDIPHFMCLFLLWSFGGWIIDVGGTSAHDGYYSSRGFLSMPLCPIYGFGTMLILFFLRPYMSNILLFYFGSAILCTLWELIVGLVLELLFKAKWWDYSDQRYQFRGLICLKCAVLWGLLCTVAVYLLIPATEQLVYLLDVRNCIIITIPFYVLLSVDTIDSVLKATHSPSIPVVCHLLQRCEKISDYIGSVVARGALLVDVPRDWEV